MTHETSVTPIAQLIDHQPQGLVVPLGTPLHMCPSTLGVDAEGIKRRFNAVGAATLEMDRDGTLLIEVANVLIYPAIAVNPDSGEESEVLWTVLIDPANESWQTTSATVRDKVGQLLALWHAGLVERPTMMQVITRKSRRLDRHYHDLIMV